MPQANNFLPLAKLTVGLGILGAAIIAFWPSQAAPRPLDASQLQSVTGLGAIKTVQGSEAAYIHVFISADCRFCREIEPELSQLRNVTVYRHLLPGHSPAGRKTASDVWCAEDRVKAWKEVAAGRNVGSAKCDTSQLQENLSLAKKLDLKTTPSIIYANGIVSAGLLSANEIIKHIAD